MFSLYPKVSALCSQKPSIGHYPEPSQSISQVHT